MQDEASEALENSAAINEKLDALMEMVTESSTAR